jgi:aminoglycoside N3'-acetyltransferase
MLAYHPLRKTKGSAVITVSELAEQLRALGLMPGDTVMVHASLRALGPVDGGADGVIKALTAAVSPRGNVMAMVSWAHSPYEETLNGRKLSPTERDQWPAFDPRTAPPYPGYGILNAALLRMEGVERSDHPDSSMAAVGPDARALVHPHPKDDAYGPGSPLERLVTLGGKILLLGAPLDAVTVLHYAEALADIPDKRRVSYEVPVLDTAGSKVWQNVEEWDSNGILDCYAAEDSMDAVESIARDYVAAGRHIEGRVGQAKSCLFEAADIVKYGVGWLEARHGAKAPDAP